MADTEAKIRAVLTAFSARPDTGPVSVALSRPSTGLELSYTDDPAQRPHFIASITKLYTTALVMQLRQEGALTLDDPIGLSLDPDLLAGLHLYRGRDYAEALTPRQLLSHTSGLAGYFDQKRTDGGTVIGDALQRDLGWTPEQALGVARSQMSPRFAPGARRRAFYSDTNFVLLGMLVEALRGRSWEQEVTDRIIRPLGLAGTWPFTLDDVDRYDQVAPIHNKAAPVRLPLTLASVRAQGGLVSTPEDGIRFLRAFLGGELFDPTYLPEMMAEWRRIFFPLRYGIGLMRYTMPRMLAGGAPREYIGHSGSSGAFLYYAPEADLYLSGTVNQMASPALAIRLMVRLAALAAK